MMDEVLKATLTSLGISGALLVVAFLLLKSYLEKRVTARINAIEQHLKGVADTAADLRKSRLEQTAKLLPELHKTAADARLLMRDGHAKLTQFNVEDFACIRESYVDLLYGAQLYLRPAAYDAAHVYKGVLDKAIVILGPTRPAQYEEISEATFTNLIKDVDFRYSSLSAALQEELHWLEKFSKENVK